MKSNIIKATILSITLFLIILISSCGHHGTGSTCTGTTYASWKADGVTYSMNQSMTAGGGLGGLDLSLVFVACSDDGIDRSVALGLLPDPPVAGTSYPLKYRSAHGWAPNGSGSAYYIVGNTFATQTNYLVDSTTHTGTYYVSTVDPGTKTFTGTFDFTGIDDGGTNVVHITNGSFTAKYN